MDIHEKVLIGLIVVSIIIIISSGVQIWHVLQDCKRRRQRRQLLKEVCGAGTTRKS